VNRILVIPLSMSLCKTHTAASWILQLLAAAILVQTLFFKFSGAEESKHIFATLGVEPWGRIATGCAELVAITLLLVPRLVSLGALLSCGLMVGAIAAHLTRLGIVVRNDGGLLFGLAVTVLLCSVCILMLRRRQIRFLGQIFLPTRSTNCAMEGCQH